MLNTLMKPKPWIIVALLVAASAFGFGNKSHTQKSCNKGCGEKKTECAPACPQPTPPTQLCEKKPAPCCPAWPVPVLNAAYNYPAEIKTQSPWDIFFTASFIYWQPTQENMELGINTAAVPPTVISQSCDYKPGFQVGLGGKFDYDNWDLYARYTWFHSTQVNTATGTIAPLNGNPSAVASSSSVNQNWNLRMDFAELLLGRWNYVGTKFTIHPTLGMRGAWIRQRVTDTYTPTTEGSSTSWAVGPQLGLDGNWMVSEGFRVYGNAEADVLYTRYTRLATVSAGSTVAQQNDYGALRTHFDVELGLGWGTYFDCHKWHVDFTAGYGFQVFFDQNMFRRFAGSASNFSFSPAGNLYVHGLTLSGRVDF
jgi:hypothetical protein